MKSMLLLMVCACASITMMQSNVRSVEIAQAQVHADQMVAMR